MIEPLHNHEYCDLPNVCGGDPVNCSDPMGTKILISGGEISEGYVRYLQDQLETWEQREILLPQVQAPTNSIVRRNFLHTFA